MEHYVTLFDNLFLPQGLALHASLKRHAGAFTLCVICLDDETKKVLDALRLPEIQTVALAEIETERLRAVRPQRTRAEYCWTLTPVAPKVVFERNASAERATYVDADMYLLKSPSPIFAEFEASRKAVMITDHAYDPEYDRSSQYGQYCVQFMIFRRTVSDVVRQWWEDRCVEWCFGRPEAGKFGDQKYLDDWPVRFANEVHVLSQLDLLLAPWNARRFPYSRAVAWHFHSLRILSRNRVLLYRAYRIPQVVEEAVYAPYITELKKATDLLRKSVPQAALRHRFLSVLKSFLGNAWRFLHELSTRDVVRKMH